MDIIDQITQTDAQQQPWQILQSVWDNTPHEVEYWKEMKSPSPAPAFTVKVEHKK